MLQLIQASIARFVEENWKRGRLGDQSFHALAGSLNGMFNFIDTPRARRQLILDDQAWHGSQPTS